MEEGACQHHGRLARAEPGHPRLQDAHRRETGGELLVAGCATTCISHGLPPLTLAMLPLAAGADAKAYVFKELEARCLACNRTVAWIGMPRKARQG
ncbi:hypothetical protein KH5H1_58180 [Corallococcus caeni]|nr:hypothetical protein KH5H1_58180 [Corallococcus sp. KH5-1]